MPEWDPRWGRRIVWGLAATYAVIFLLSAMSGSIWGWTLLSAFFSDIARDLPPGGASPWDGYDGVVAGPLAWAVVEAPLLAALGRIGLVHVLATCFSATSAILLTERLVTRHHGQRAGVIAAALLTLPPPSLWLHAHAGAYHALILPMFPIGLLLLGDPMAPPRRARELAGVAWLTLAVSIQLGNIGVVGPTLFVWAALRRRSTGFFDWRFYSQAVGAAFVGASPVLWKLWFHTPWGGLVPPSGPGVSAAVKPIFLVPPSPWGLLDRLGTMLWTEGPYGLHWELAGLPWLALPWFLGAWGLWAAAAWSVRRGGGRGALLLVGPVGVLLAGMLTCWFVLYPGEEEGFSRDGRHLTSLLLCLAWSGGIGASALLTGGGRWGTLIAVGTAAGLSVMMGAGALGLVRTVDKVGLTDLQWKTPYRLSSRFVTGYFRAPFFLADPLRGGASCLTLPPQDSVDCLRGVAMGFGSRAAMDVIRDLRVGVPTLAACRLVAEGGRRPDLADELADACALGLGWGISDLLFRRTSRAVERCDADPSWGPRGRQWCVRGVGWATVQNFGDRPVAVSAWFSLVPPSDAGLLAEGAGILLGMMSADPHWVGRICSTFSEGDDQAGCRRMARWNDGFMGEG